MTDAGCLCRTCAHNTYAGDPSIRDWVSCCHPTTIRKTPSFVAGDPEWVNLMTGDARAGMISVTACACYEQAALKEIGQ